MRKITFYLLSLFCLSLPMSVFAQLEELEHMAVSIGSAAESITPDTQWYLVYNSREYTTAGGGYWWDYGFYNGEDGVGTIYMSQGPDVVYDGLSASRVAEYLVRFITVDSPDAPYDEYYVQFGTGNYVWTPSEWNGASTDVLKTVATIEEASTLYAYYINDEAGHFGFLTTDGNLWRIDENGSGATVCLWNSGEAASSGGNNDFTLYPIYFVETSEWDEAFTECASVYSQYIDYYDSFTAGTTYGCCDADAIAAFQAALDAAALIDSPEADDFTVDQLYEMAQAIIDTYDAVVATRIPLAMEIEEGYYLLNNAFEFTEETDSYEDPETGEVIPGETVVVVKGMYSEMGSDGTIYAMWKTAERSCPFLWKVTANGDKTYELFNMATDATFNNVATSTNVTMSEDSENLMVFDAGEAYGQDGNVLIRVSTQAEGGMYYLHCGGHSNGAGVSGNIVGWGSGAGASYWVLVPVSDEEAEALIEEYAPIKEGELRYQNAQTMINDAKPKMVIAEDTKLGEEGLIASVDQLSSPYTTDDDGYSEGLSDLLDGDSSTYWHTEWHDGTVPAGTHYLQVELTEPHEDVVFVFTRRPVANDHITLWGVYGVPTDDAEKDDCTLIAEISTPYGTNTETLTSDIFDVTGFTTLRFYFEDTYYSGGDSRGYAHMSEFQLYDAFENETSQKVALGSIYTDLEAAIALAEEEGEDITVETYNTLQSAYDAFIAAYVDPTELRSALADAGTATEGLVIGTDPGYWSGTESADALNATVAEATAYDASGVYTQSRSDGYVETLVAQMADITGAAIKVQEGKWYEFRYATLEEVEANGWNAESGVGTDTQPALYGKYVTVAALVEEDGVYTVDPLEQGDLDDICLGHGLYFLDRDEFRYADYAKFRFINVGDTAYMMQNKATGLFLKAAGTSGYVTLSVHPTLFNVSALGFGENLISGVTLDGESQNNLHAQRDYNQLVTWETSTVGSNSGLYIEDIGEEVASDYEGADFNMSLSYGALYTFCYPVSVTANEGTIYGVYVDGSTVTLVGLDDNTAEAGQPFVYVVGDLEDYDSSSEEEILTFSHGYDIEREAQTVGKLVGSYYGGSIGAGKLVADGNGFSVSRSSSSVSANGAYINGDYATGDVIEIEFGEGQFDGVEAALSAVALEGNIYSIDGKLLGKGNLNTLKTLGKGIYIINGVKVAVK